VSEPRNAPEHGPRAATPPVASPGTTEGGRVPAGPVQPPGEIDGPRGPEPTRFGDWEKGGRCTDF
jgi:hypothetical protein